jgi:hypothetical protein
MKKNGRAADRRIGVRRWEGDSPGSRGLPVFESISHSFIVRIMLEPDPAPGTPGEWKGMIQHVVSGERRFFRDLNEIPGLIVQLIGRDRETRKDDSGLRGMTPPPKA